MVSQFDTSYNDRFRRPTYDSIEDEKVQQLKREADELLEVRPPPIPTPEMEREYMDWLQADFKSDPWITHRFRKYTANPKRIPWKNYRELRRQYQYNFAFTWVVGSIATWPIAVYIGKMYQKTWTGVPLVPMQWYKHDFINVQPGAFARRQFRLFSFGSSALMGFLLAYTFVDRDGWRSDKWKNRPDMRPYPAMVK